VLIGYTILQEIAYIALLFSTYALYRSVRLRDPWPVVVAGLAFVCGVAIAAPRILTVATDIPDVARTTVNFLVAPVEVLRFFGDGLLGRTVDENEAVRGATINLHEGVQILTSPLGAWAAVLAGLVARSGVARAWGIALVLILSTAIALWWRPVYDSLGRFEPFSREFRIVVMNAVVLGVPLWFGARALVRRPAAHGGASPSVVDETPGAELDTPFLLAFSALGLAAIILPEAHTVLYYAFMRMDFQHGRLSMAVALPVAALVTILLSRFLPATAGPPARRWLVGGLALGLALWLAREALAGFSVTQLGEVMEALRPRRLLTIETVRVATSLLVVLVAVGLLVGRSRHTVLACAGGVLVAWVMLESVSAAEFRMNGPHNRQQAVPFEALSPMVAPPGRLRIPTEDERAVLRQRLEADQYRVVLQQRPNDFPALIEPHLAAIWDLRLVEGYSTGLPRRFEWLPWNPKIVTAHHLDINTEHQLPWHLLAALNVKYVVSVDQSLWYNPAPGGTIPPLDVQRLRIQENPNPVAPRAFFAARVSPAGDPPMLPGDTGERPPRPDPPIPDPRTHSVAEGVAADRTYATAGTVGAVFDGDRVSVRVEPSAEDRFLVVNERYYAGWRATVDGRPTEIYPTNLLMRGVIVPAGARIVEMQYVPFIVSWYGVAVLVAGLLLTGLVSLGLRFAATRWPRRRAA
jgi:hypothetical protein